eukprot:jgi/Astpho2/8618/Aster-x0362
MGFRRLVQVTCGQSGPCAKDVQGSVVMCFSGKHWIWPLKGAPPDEQLLRWLWGGHAEDMLVECTSKCCYQTEPLNSRMVRFNGSLMLAGEFERHSGQRKSKKWKQSVKIHPPAADGFNSVERWLVKEGSELFGRQVDNKVVWVLWPAQSGGVMYRGRVVSYRRASTKSGRETDGKGTHLVQYDCDGQMEQLYLAAEVLHWPRKKEAGTETSSSGVTPTRSGSWAADVETFAGPALMLVDDDEAVKSAAAWPEAAAWVVIRHILIHAAKA